MLRPIISNRYAITAKRTSDRGGNDRRNRARSGERAINNALTEPPDAAAVYDDMRWMPPILLLLAVTASSGCNSGSGAAVMADDQDLFVLRAIVDSDCTAGSKQVVSDLPLAPLHDLPGSLSGTVAISGSSRAVRSPAEVKWPRGHICATVQVVDDAVIEEVLSRETSIPPQWTFFRERFDDARRLMRFSLPAYSADGRTALVYAEGTCPYSCGTGVLYELRNTGNRWTIVGRENASNP